MSDKTLKLIHFIACAIALIQMSVCVSKQVGIYLINYLDQNIQFSNWALQALEIDKPSQMLAYFVASILMLIYFIFGYFRFGRSNTQLIVNTPAFSPEKWILVVLFAGLYFALYRAHHYWSLIPCWIILAILPYWMIQIKIKSNVTHYIGMAILLGVFIQLWMTFLPFVVTTPKVENDFFDIPEMTFLQGKEIDNTNFINSHRLAGLMKYDPRNASVPTLKAGYDFIELNKSDKLLQFISSHKRYAYDDYYHGVFVTERFTDIDRFQLCQVLNDQEQCNKVTDFYKNTEAAAKRHYSPLELDFLKRNKYEMKNQVIAGHYFHHQNALLGSINSYLLGKPQSETVYLYGWLHTIILAGFLKSAGLNFANYIKLTNFIYPLYYSFILLAALIIFRNVWLALLTALISFWSLFFIGFNPVHFASGFVPSRHFFDVFVLLSLYGCLFKERYSKLYFFLTVLFAVLSVFLNKEFGVFIFMSLSMMMALKFLSQLKVDWPKVGMLGLGLMAISIWAIKIKTFPNLTSIYYLIGVTIPHTSYGLIRNCLWLLALLYGFILFYRWHDERWKWLAFYLLCYGHFALVYFIWNPDPGHYFMLLSMWSFLAVILLNEIFSQGFLKRYQKKIMVGVSLLFFMLAYIPAAAAFYSGEKLYWQVFKDHKLYAWNFPTAKFNSTMDPAPFENAIGLINKYAAGKGIYLISKYDNILPFLAGKYNQMPFLQTDVSLVTKKEIMLGAQAILKTRPDYIFIDANIAYGHQGDVFHPADPVANEWDRYSLSVGRAQVINNLYQVFNQINSSYELIERGQLISVYKRKVTNDAQA